MCEIVDKTKLFKICYITEVNSLSLNQNQKLFTISFLLVALCHSFWRDFEYFFHASVLLLSMNFVITLSKWLWIHEALMMKFIVNNKPDVRKPDVNLFFTITNLSNCRLPSLINASHKLKIRLSVRLLTMKISQRAHKNFCSNRKHYIVSHIASLVQCRQ